MTRAWGSNAYPEQMEVMVQLLRWLAEDYFPGQIKIFPADAIVHPSPSTLYNHRRMLRHGFRNQVRL